MSDAIETPRPVIQTGLPAQVPTDYLSEVDLEHAHCSEIGALVRLPSRDERIVPGYFRDPDWTVKDLVAHLGVWPAEAATELTNMANAYEPRDLDVDIRNAETLAARRNEPSDVVWGHAVSARASGGSRCGGRAIRPICGCARPGRSTMVSIYPDCGPGSPNWSRRGPARPATSGLHRTSSTRHRP